MANGYILLEFTPLSPFSTYKYHWGVRCMGKDTTTDTTNTRVLSKVFFFSSLYFFKAVVFIRFEDSSLHSIDMTGCCILGEKRIWF